MAVLGKYWQTPTERKRYVIDYTDWLDAATGERVLTAAFVGVALSPIPDPLIFPVPPPLNFSSTVDPNGKKVYVFVSGGVDGVQYKALVSITTSGAQNKDDEFLVNVKAL